MSWYCSFSLVFQFETIETKHERDDDHSDLHLFLPVEMVVVDRQKEEANKIEFNIHTPAGITESWWNTGSEFSVAAGNSDGQIHCDHKIGEFEKKVSEENRLITKGSRRYKNNGRNGTKAPTSY